MTMQEPYEEALVEALDQLATARALLLDDIARYPSPISGCDAQFNQLLSDRRRILGAISALEDTPFVPTPRVLERGALPESR